MFFWTACPLCFSVRSPPPQPLPCCNPQLWRHPQGPAEKRALWCPESIEPPPPPLTPSEAEQPSILSLSALRPHTPAQSSLLREFGLVLLKLLIPLGSCLSLFSPQVLYQASKNSKTSFYILMHITYHTDNNLGPYPRKYSWKASVQIPSSRNALLTHPEGNSVNSFPVPDVLPLARITWQ